MKARPPVLQKHKICLQLPLPSPENTPASHSCERTDGQTWTDTDAGYGASYEHKLLWGPSPSVQSPQRPREGRNTP